MYNTVFLCAVFTRANYVVFVRQKHVKIFIRFSLLVAKKYLSYIWLVLLTKWFSRAANQFFKFLAVSGFDILSFKDFVGIRTYTGVQNCSAFTAGLLG